MHDVEFVLSGVTWEGFSGQQHQLSGRRATTAAKATATAAAAL